MFVSYSAEFARSPSAPAPFYDSVTELRRRSREAHSVSLTLCPSRFLRGDAKGQQAYPRDLTCQEVFAATARTCASPSLSLSRSLSSSPLPRGCPKPPETHNLDLQPDTERSTPAPETLLPHCCRDGPVPRNKTKTE